MPQVILAADTIAEYNPVNPSQPSSRTGTIGTHFYEPPSPSSPSGSNTGTAGRKGGCAGNIGTSLTALAPQSHVGQTVSTHPTFAWFVPDAQSFSTELRLFQSGAKGKSQLIQKIELSSSPGIMKQSLPLAKPGLVVGQRYHWQVVINCDPNHPSSALVTDAEIAVVPLTPSLKTALAATNDHTERTRLYAQAGLWYDALSEALESPNDTETRKSLLTLLKDLVQLEEPSSPTPGGTQRTVFRQILERLTPSHTGLKQQ